MYFCRKLENVCVKMSDAELITSDVEMEQEEDFRGQGEEEVYSELDKLAFKLVRACLSLNLNSVALSSVNLRKVAFADQKTSVSVKTFELALEKANGILQDVYAYAVVPLAPKVITSAKGTKSVSKTKQYALVNVMNDNLLRFHEECLWIRHTEKLFPSELLEKRHDYRNSKENFPYPFTETDLMLRGIAMAVVMIIAVSNNHMTEEELLNVLQTNFGFSTTEPLDVLNISTRDLLKLLDKLEYVNRTVIRTENDELAEYTVGRRGLREVDRDAFRSITQVLYDEGEERAEFTNLVDATIEPAYGKVGRADAPATQGSREETVGTDEINN